MTELLFDNLEITSDAPCSRRDFIEAYSILNSNPEADAPLSKKQSDNERVTRILKIARRRADVHDILLWEPGTSDKILLSLARGDQFRTRWVAIYVKEILYPVYTSSESTLFQIINTIPTIPGNKKLSPIHLKILEKIALQEHYVGSLIEFFGISSESMSGYLNRLEKRYSKNWSGEVEIEKYIERYSKNWSGEDGRRVYVKLTESWVNLNQYVLAGLEKM